jgi:hypothetical protein
LEIFKLTQYGDYQVTWNNGSTAIISLLTAERLELEQQLVERKKLYSQLARTAGIVAEVSKGTMQNLNDMAVKHYYQVERVLGGYDA